MLRFRPLVILLCGLVVLASGCSSKKAVQLLVTLDGKPVDDATVVLMAEGTAGQAINGSTGPDGIVNLNTVTKDGIPPGTYKVLITKVKVDAKAMDPSSPEAMKMMKGGGPKGKSELPRIYGEMKTPLTITIPLASSPAKMELKSKP